MISYLWKLFVEERTPKKLKEVISWSGCSPFLYDGRYRKEIIRSLVTLCLKVDNMFGGTKGAILVINENINNFFKEIDYGNLNRFKNIAVVNSSKDIIIVSKMNLNFYIKIDIFLLKF